MHGVDRPVNDMGGHHPRQSSIQREGPEIGCQIIVNDVVKDERSITGVNAETFCIVKSA
ncbi:MAG: hypothetical protein B7Z80_13365 [Rhodospirillales bacterium 20-64-7]|nr:MAG: hypothetical protein B7Z80_13365 [Rhodospirillales bacterium 20-64-7]